MKKNKFKYPVVIFVLAAVFIVAFKAQKKTLPADDNINYINNRPPLRANPYIELPLGAIHPGGWLKEMLLRMKSGSTGCLDSLYPQVVGKRNGWLGGDGDVWERGPYWLDGLVPLAYILDDAALKAKVQPWIEWSIDHQQPGGYFGPMPSGKKTAPEPGLQKGRARDWWPKMVMLKVLKQYYEATRDRRVIDLMTKYFHYQLKHLPETPLDHWSWWGAQRGGDNLMVVYWLYNITGDKSLLKLGDLIYKQTVDWSGMFLQGDVFRGYFKLHGVNLAMGIKEPVIYYQQHPEQRYEQAVVKGLKEIKEYDGQPEGLFGADEWLHGKDPVNGSELCSAVESMFSFEKMLQITGNTSFADHIEKITFNALPTQITDDFMYHQYFQQPNQVMITRHKRNFYTEYNGTEQVFGLLTGYPCCTCNMHQGWPKFTQNLWYATRDGGVAALLYAPSSVDIKVAGGVPVRIVESTGYPFRDTINFHLNVPEATEFSFCLRIPGWCKKGIIKINGRVFKTGEGGNITKINRIWHDNDVVELVLPMEIKRSDWYENSVAVQRGPLVYALKIKEKWRWINNKDKYGPYYEVFPGSPWNYGLVDIPESRIKDAYKITYHPMASYPWNVDNAPVEITVPAKRLPFWKLYNQSAGRLPYSVQKHTQDLPEENVTLIPYGCTTLRITEFPEVR